MVSLSMPVVTWKKFVTVKVQHVLSMDFQLPQWFAEPRNPNVMLQNDVLAHLPFVLLMFRWPEVLHVMMEITVPSMTSAQILEYVVELKTATAMSIATVKTTIHVLWMHVSIDDANTPMPTPPWSVDL